MLAMWASTGRRFTTRETASAASHTHAAGSGPRNASASSTATNSASKKTARLIATRLQRLTSAIAESATSNTGSSHADVGPARTKAGARAAIETTATQRATSVRPAVPELVIR